MKAKYPKVGKALQRWRKCKIIYGRVWPKLENYANWINTFDGGVDVENSLKWKIRQN